MTVEELKKYYQTSWFAWLFLPATLGRSLSLRWLGSTQHHPKTTPWIEIANICQAFESVGPTLRWLFKQSLGRFYDGQTYQRYFLLSPTLRHAASRHLYLYMVFHAKNPERMAVLLEQFESKLSQYPQSRLEEFTRALNHAGPIFFTDLFSALQDSLLMDGPFQGRLLNAAGWLPAIGGQIDENNYLKECGLNFSAFDVAQAQSGNILSAVQRSNNLHALFNFLLQVARGQPTTWTYEGFLAPLVQAIAQHPDPEQAMNSFIMDNNHLVLLLPKLPKNVVTKERIACMQTLHARNLTDQLPEALFAAMCVYETEFSRLLGLMQDADVLPPVQSWCDVETILKSVISHRSKPIEDIETLRDEQLLTPRNLMDFSRLVKHYPFESGIVGMFVALKRNGIIDTQSMRDYLESPASLQYIHLSEFMPTLNVFHHLGWLDGDNRLDAGCIRAFCFYRRTDPVERILHTLNKHLDLSDDERDNFLTTTARIFEPTALCQFFEAAKQYALPSNAGDAQAISLNTDPVDILSSWGFDPEVFTRIDTLPELQLSPKEKTQYLLDALAFLHKINKTTLQDLTPVLMQAVVNHPAPEQALIAWVGIHRRLFLWMNPDKVRVYAQKREWTDWITRIRILQSENVIDKLPRLLFDGINRVGYQYSSNVQLESLTNIIVALQRINLLHVLLLPEIETILENLNISFYFKFNEMTQVFDELSQNAVLTAETIMLLSSLFKAFGKCVTESHTSNIQNLKTTLITMKQKGILDTASMQDYLVYEPFLVARVNGIRYGDRLFDFEPALDLLHQLGLLDGEGRLSAFDLHRLDFAGQDDLLKQIMNRLVSNVPLNEDTGVQYLNIATRLLQLDRYVRGVTFNIWDTPGADDKIKNTMELYQLLLPAEQLPAITLSIHTLCTPLNSLIRKLQYPRFPQRLTMQINGSYGVPEEQRLYNALSSQTTIPVGLRVILNTPGEQQEQMDELCDRPFNDTVACLTFMTGIVKNNHKYNSTPLESLREIFAFVVGWHAPEPTRTVEFAIRAIKHRTARDTFFAEKTLHLQVEDLDQLDMSKGNIKK